MEEKEETFAKSDEKMFSSVKDESIFPTSSNRRESLSSMLFSPLRDSDSSFSSNIGGGSASRDLESRTETGRQSALRRFSSDSVFSPLRDSPGPGSGNVSAKRTPYTSFSTPPTMSPLTIIREEARPEVGSSLESERVVSGQDKLSLESLGSFVKETINTASKSPVFQTTAPTRTDLSSYHKSPGQEKSPVEKPTPSEFINVITAFPHLIEGRETFNGPPQPDISSAVNRIADKLSSGDSPLTVNNNNKPGPGAETFHREYISSVVSEAMSEWCEGVDSRLWSFHYGLLRQLQTHQEETKSLLAEMTGLTEMRAEVQRLRQENSELRKFFGTNPS